MMIEGLNPGRFTLNAAMLKGGDVDLLLALMGRCVIVRAEYNFMADLIEYEAYSLDFAELPEGQAVPLYEWKATEERDPETGERTAFSVTAERA